MVSFALAMLLAQATPSPAHTACPPTSVIRVKPKTYDPEYHDHGGGYSARWCKGIICFVVDILVTVNADGTVKDAVVKAPWGYGADEAALYNARRSTYRPATIECKPVEGTYLFRELFLIHRDSY